MHEYTPTTHTKETKKGQRGARTALGAGVLATALALSAGGCRSTGGDVSYPGDGTTPVKPACATIANPTSGFAENLHISWVTAPVGAENVRVVYDFNRNKSSLTGELEAPYAATFGGDYGDFTATATVKFDTENTVTPTAGNPVTEIVTTTLQCDPAKFHISGPKN